MYHLTVSQLGAAQCMLYVCMYMLTGDQLRANRQMSVYVNSSSQNIAPSGKTIPNESITCICFIIVKEFRY